jgi:hypothetical protein
MKFDFKKSLKRSLKAAIILIAVMIPVIIASIVLPFIASEYGYSSLGDLLEEFFGIEQGDDKTEEAPPVEYQITSFAVDSATGDISATVQVYGNCKLVVRLVEENAFFSSASPSADRYVDGYYAEQSLAIPKTDPVTEFIKEDVTLSFQSALPPEFVAEAVIISLENLFSEVDVLAFKHRNERAVRQRKFISLSVLYVRELQIGVAKSRADVIGAVSHFARGSKEKLTLGRKNVRSAAADLINASSIRFELGLGCIERFEGFLGDRHYFGSCKGSSARNSNVSAHCFSAEVLIEAVCGILVALAACVAVKLRKANGNLIVKAKKVEQGCGAFAELALKFNYFFGEGFEFLVFFEPSVIAFEHIREVPGIFNGNFASFQYFLSHNFPP